MKSIGRLAPGLAAVLAIVSASARAEPPPVPAQAPTTAAAQPAMSLIGVGFATADLDRTLRFYRDGLGLIELTRLPLGDVVEVILGFDRSGHAPNILLLGRKDGKPMAEASVARPDKTVLSAPDATAVAARLAAAGYAPAAIKVNPAMDVRNFFVTDPDGRRLEIVQLGRSLQAPH